MAFGQDFLRSFFGNDYLKDYRHASRTFRTNGYENSPRFKYLFHVYFNLNTSQIPQLRNVMSTPDVSTVGLLVKSIELPTFKLDTETLNQYNRKRVVQKKIEYQPINVTFHDDGGDLIRTLWYNYYSYYYKDPAQQYNSPSPTNGSMGQDAVVTTGFDYNSRDIYSNSRFVNDWGYIGEAYSDGQNVPGGKPAFFRDINIYGFNQHRFVQYVLINPLISEWRHDTYDYAEGEGTMSNQVSIAYETVKYYTGAIGDTRTTGGSTFVQGFGNTDYYDRSPSPLSRPGGTASILGQGGLLDAGLGIYQDLQSGSVAGVVGAIQTAGRAYNTASTVDLRASVGQELTDTLSGVLRNTVPGQLRTQPGSGVSIQQQLQAPIFAIPNPRGNSIPGAAPGINPAIRRGR